MEESRNQENGKPKHSRQRGYISEPIHTRRGICRQIRYRVQNGDGSWIHKSERLYDRGKKEARAILDQRLTPAAEAAPPSPNPLVRDFVYYGWLPYKKRCGLSPSTLSSYEVSIKNIVPPICWRPLAAVTPELLTEVINQRRLQAKPKTVLNEVRVLHNVFQLAVDIGLLECNPVGRDHRPQVERTAIKTWTLAQMRAIVGETPAEYRALMATAAVGEVAFGELLRLSRDDLDFARQSLRVRKGRAGRKATRLVPVGPRLLQLLADHLERTPPSPPANLVFPDPVGGKINPHLLKKEIYLVLNRLRFPRRGVGFASFRCSRKALLTAPWGDPRLIAAVGEQRRLLAAAGVASAGAEKRAVALALEQAILAGGSSAVAQAEQAEAPAAQATGTKGCGKAKIARIPLDIASAGGEQAAVPAATPEGAQDAVKPKIQRIPLDTSPAAAGPPGEAPATKRKIERLKLEAFLGGGL